MNRRFGALTAPAAGHALAAANPSGTGQPSPMCGSATAPTTAGQSANGPGSAFHPTGVAGSRYAGIQLQHANNPKSVSQYDVTC